MKRKGIIHAGLALHLAALRHTDTFVICDSGLPLAASTPCVDLGYRYGAPRFTDVIAVILPELVIEASWISEPMLTANPDCLNAIRQHGLQPEPVSHDDFKALIRDVSFAVRTGEDTRYANLLCRAGVAFT
jgi:D-ribose pyranase